jgi:hypothetical protein
MWLKKTLSLTVTVIKKIDVACYGDLKMQKELIHHNEILILTIGFYLQ